MADPLLPTQLGDLSLLTQKNLGKPRIVEIATPLQEYTFARRILKRSRVREESGYTFTWAVKVAQAGNFRHVGLGAPDIVNISDTSINASADWRNSVVAWAMIAQEMDMNSEPSKIVDLEQSRRQDAMIDQAVGMERAWWGPPVSISDVTTPWGVNTWLPKNATEGFNGTVPSGYSTMGGINPSTYTAWKSYTFQYTDMTQTDGVRKWRTAATKTGFKPPVDQTLPSFNKGDQYAYFTNYGVIGPLEEFLDTRNENLGPDIAKNDGAVVFRRVPVEWVPYLDSDTTNPIYGLNFGWINIVILKNWWMKPTHIENYPGAHTMSANFMDSTYQFIFRNRRAHFVGATGTTYPA